MNIQKKMWAAVLVFLLVIVLAVPVCAAPGDDGAEAASADNSTGMRAISVGLAIGLAAAGGAIGMGIVGGKAADGISRQPDMEGKIRTTLMLDLVFIETAIIYALLVVILVIFVL